MAVTRGIAKISGVPVATISKDSGVAKDNIWSFNGEQREASLFSTLTNTGWASYTQGKNSASFTAVGSSSGRGLVYFANPNHTQGDVYNYNFTKDATDGGKTWSLAVSSNATFDAIGELNGVALTTSAGVVNASVIASNIPTGTAYIGIIKAKPTSTDSIQVTNLIVTRV